MPDLLSEKTVTARKAHRCATCNTTAIQPGQTYRRETYVYDGRVYDWVQCIDCSGLGGIVYEWTGQPEEGVGFEDYVEWARELQDDPEFGERARAYLSRMGMEEERND